MAGISVASDSRRSPQDVRCARESYRDTELGENEAAAIAGFEVCKDFAGKGEERKAIGYTKKFKLVDRLRALELYDMAQCYYADEMALMGVDGQSIEVSNNIAVEFLMPARISALVTQ